jgi:hypothetical protein
MVVFAGAILGIGTVKVIGKEHKAERQDLCILCIQFGLDKTLISTANSTKDRAVRMIRCAKVKDALRHCELLGNTIRLPIL